MDLIQEGNISNIERYTRQLKSILHGYRPGVDINSLSYKLTSKGNWNVYDADNKKICLISKFILPQDIAVNMGISPEINESSIDGLVDKNNIIAQLKSLGISPSKCIIQDSGVVDLMGDTEIKNRNVDSLGLQFGTCKGNFKLTNCKNLRNLLGSPDDVIGDFICSDLNIISLQGSPDHIKGVFSLINCSKLTSVKDAPISVEGDAIFNNSPVDVKYFSKMCKVSGKVDIING